MPQARRPQAHTRAVPWCDAIRLQLDGATPHTGGGLIAKLNEIGETFNPPIRVQVQPPQSPETNVLDLCVFSSWARRNHKLQRHARAGDKWALWANMQRSWAEYPPEKIERAFQNRKLALQKIIELKGGNRFQIPRVSPDVREKLLAPAK